MNKYINEAYIKVCSACLTQSFQKIKTLLYQYYFFIHVCKYKNLFASIS